jgi:PPOX class probable FMN-dependent enzyme
MTQEAWLAETTLGEPDPHAIASLHELRERYGEPAERAVSKELPALDEASAAFIAAAPFLLLATAGVDGSCDVSPKGGPAGFVKVVDERRLLVPDFPGNRRFDGVANLVDRPGIALLFAVPGINETLRVNGTAHLTRDPELLRLAAAEDGREPWFVADVRVRQVFSHCGKAFLRSGLWRPESWPDPDEVPSPSGSIRRLARERATPQSVARVEHEAGYGPLY